MKKNLSVNVKNQNYPFSITQKIIEEEKLFFLHCPEAQVSQYFDTEDLVSIMNDLPELIIDEQARQRKIADQRVQFRVSGEEKIIIEKKASKEGKTISEYIRNLAIS